MQLASEAIMSELEIEVCDCNEVHTDVVDEVRAHLPKEYLLDDLAEVFKVFGDKTRMKILYILHEQELCVCDIAQLLDMNQSAISHQLKVLKQAKLIKNRREGKQMYYSLADDHVHTILSMGMEHIMEKD